MKPYNKSNILLAKILRRNMTAQEKKLWYDFLKFYPIRFQRQKAIGDYIADFYCAKAGLVIELDGRGHSAPEQIKKDEERTEKLNLQGMTVLRVKNTEIDKDFRGVCALIDEIVKELMAQRKA